MHWGKGVGSVKRAGWLNMRACYAPKQKQSPLGKVPRRTCPERAWSGALVIILSAVSHPSSLHPSVAYVRQDTAHGHSTYTRTLSHPLDPRSTYNGAAIHCAEMSQTPPIPLSPSTPAPPSHPQPSELSSAARRPSASQLLGCRGGASVHSASQLLCCGGGACRPGSSQLLSCQGIAG